MKNSFPMTLPAGGILSGLLVATACSSGGESGIPAYESRDSAGVEVVWTGPPMYPDSVTWVVELEPALQIGTQGGEFPYLLSRVRDAGRTPDGRIVILEGESLELRVFGPDGVHIRSFGRRGDGPLEFERWPKMTLAPPDTVVVWDPGHGRLSWFDLSGGLLRQSSFLPLLAELGGLMGSPWQVHRDGALLMTSPVSGRDRDGSFDNPVRIGVVDEEGEVHHDFGQFPFGNGYAHPMGFSFAGWFGPRVLGAIGPESLRVALSAPEEWEIRFYSSNGDLTRIMKAPIQRVAVSPEIRDARRAYTLDIALQIGLTEGDADRIEDGMPVPDSLPAISRMLWDRGDRLWVGRREADPQKTEFFDVFDTDGRWITTVHLPSDLGSIREIGEDYVLLVWWDDLQVPYLRLHRLRRNEG
jgi:hypothetical protein